jgi:LCP family protein required for cell wall assembly
MPDDAPSNDAPSQVPTSRHPHRGRQLLLAVTASFALVVALAAGAGAASFLWAQRVVTGHGHGIDSQGVAGDTQPTIGGLCDRDACNYLLLGSDDRSGLSHSEQVAFGTNKDIGGSQRSDTIILVHTEQGSDRATIMSFPRDLWVNIPGHGQDKINAAFEGGIHGGGPDLVAKTIENLTGLHINHFMYVNLAGFEGVVNALGGVRMCVPYPMQDIKTALNIPAGCQEFDGATALAFVRTRSQPCDTIPDFARIGRQQQFFRALLTKLLSPGEITNLPSLVRPAASNIYEDKGFGIFDMLGLVKDLSGITTGDADFRAVPANPAVLHTSAYPSGIDVVTLAPEAKKMFAALRTGKPLGNLGKQLDLTTVSEANIEVHVYDKASKGKADEVEKIVGESGFDVGDGAVLAADELKGAAQGSAILYTKAHKDMADVVAGYFPNLKEVQVGKGVITKGDIAIQVTSDYKVTQPGSNGPVVTCTPAG